VDKAGRVSTRKSQNYGGGRETRFVDTAGRVSTHESQNYGGGRKTRLADKAGRVSTRKFQKLRSTHESQNYGGGRKTTGPDGKGVHIQVRSSGVNGVKLGKLWYLTTRRKHTIERCN